ncbi:MAG: nitroreductase family protein [Clostridiaceae bacterium]|nr:nitroreductase family protein [Clostridiaceae bacterium]
MEAMEMLLGRRSIRKFKSEQIKDSELEAVLKAGEYAPSGANQQGAFYIVVQEPEARRKIAAMNANVMGKTGTDPYYGAPTVILAFAEQGKATPFEDACLGLGNMYNAAYALGLGSVWIHRTRQMFESEEGKALLKQWGIEKELVGVGSCALGYPDCPHPAATPRKDDFVAYVR